MAPDCTPRAAGAPTDARPPIPPDAPAARPRHRPAARVTAAALAPAHEASRLSLGLRVVLVAAIALLALAPSGRPPTAALHRELVAAGTVVSQAVTEAAHAATALAGAATAAAHAMTGVAHAASDSGSSAWMDVAPGIPPYNLILLSLDTTRSDRLSCYGFAKATTPSLDRLATEGILFENAYTPVPVTLPAHTTMLTGLLPFEHGVRNNGTYVVPPEAVTLAELLKSHGYATGAVLGAFPLDGRFGLNQGFDTYDDRFPAAAGARDADVSQRPAHEVTRLALEWLDLQRGRPFFLWCHYYDPHGPYVPPEPYKTRFAGDPYAGEVAAMDAAIGSLIDALRARGLLEQTVILAAGDHGEGLGQHGERTHMNFIYETTQRVPMLLRLPAERSFAGRGWRGVRVPGLVNLTDIVPTLWNALGLPRAELPAVSGLSLLPVVVGQAPAHGWVYHETLVPDQDYGASELRGYQDARWKYIRAPRPELYDLQKDPAESKNLADREPVRRQSMEASLALALRKDPGVRAPQTMDPETIERLRSLGYVASGSSLSSTGDKPDPKDMHWVMDALAEVQARTAANRPQDALRLADSVLAAFPRAPLAQAQRAICLTQLGRGNEAVRAYDLALADCRGCAAELDLKGQRIQALLTAGQTEEARAAIRTLVRDHPRTPGLNRIQGEVYEATGDPDRARAAYLLEAELVPRDPLPWLKLGILEAARGRTAEAEKAYRRALEISPQYPDALIMLGELLDRLGRTAEASALTEQAMASDPGHPGALMRWALSLQRQGRSEEALQSYQACLERQPGHPVVLFNLGTLYGQMGRTTDAARAYQDAIATGKAPLGAYANFGVLLANQGKLAEATQAWEEGLRRSPNGPDATTVREYLRRARSLQK